LLNCTAFQTQPALLQAFDVPKYGIITKPAMLLKVQHSLKKQMYAIVLSINQHPSKLHQG
jgi:hypothetical protein